MKLDKFKKWLAGIIDGDGNFDIRKNNKLKAIRIKLHNRDIRILVRIQNYLHIGRIKSDKKKPYSTFIISTQKEMSLFVALINGHIRIKIPSFKKACSYLNIQFIEPNYIIEPFDSYFAGLIDSDGTVVFNFSANRIECNIEFKNNRYSQLLCLDNVIPNYVPKVYLRHKKNQTPGRIFKSITFRFQTVQGMIHLYHYFLVNRLYCDFKFYRIMKIKYFIEIRHYANYPFNSLEYQIYSNFLLDFIQYRNPLWTKVHFINKLNTKKIG